MIIKAEQKYVRMSPRKVRLVADLVRKLTPSEALQQLELLRKRAALPVSKVLKQALANATNNHDLKEEDLRIHRIEVVEGSTYKRWQAVSRGRAHSILKRSSHIAVFLESTNDETTPSQSKKVKKTENVGNKPRRSKPLKASKVITSEKKKRK